MTNHYHNPLSRLAHTLAVTTAYSVLAVSLLTPMALGWLDGAPRRSVTSTTPAIGILPRGNKPPVYSTAHRKALDAFIKRMKEDAK